MSFNLLLCSDVALAIIQSDQWEDAMSQYDERDEITPMRLLIRSMPGMPSLMEFD